MYALTRLHPVDAGEFRASMETVAEYRKVTLTTLLPALAPMGESQASPTPLSTSATGRWNPIPKSWE